MLTQWRVKLTCEASIRNWMLLNVDRMIMTRETSIRSSIGISTVSWSIFFSVIYFPTINFVNCGKIVICVQHLSPLTDVYCYDIDNRILGGMCVTVMIKITSVLAEPFHFSFVKFNTELHNCENIMGNLKIEKKKHDVQTS